MVKTVDPARRTFLKLAGASAGSMLLAACGDTIQAGHPASMPSSTGSPPDAGASSTPQPDPQTSAGPQPQPDPGSESQFQAEQELGPQSTTSPEMAALQAHLRAYASPTASLPPVAAAIPRITWAGRLGGNSTTTLPAGRKIAVSSLFIGGPARYLYRATLPGNPVVDGFPCMVLSRPFTCKGRARAVSSPTVLYFKTDAPVFELTGVVPDGSSTTQTMIVDGQLVPPKVLTSSRATGSWNVGTIRVDFGSRAVRDIWIETGLHAAYLKIDANDLLPPTNAALGPQITVVGDSYQGCRSDVFGNTAGIALEIGARLGIRKVMTDAMGGTGYWNSGGDQGNLNDRLRAHAADNSTIYLVMAGLNDYGDITNSQLIWPTRAQYEQSVYGYAANLRSAKPKALIIITAPFCPVPPMSDASYIARPDVNGSGIGDFLYKAQLHKDALQRIPGPWIYIDTLMGTGWLNSAGASGGATGLQWLTGGTPGAGTSATYKPGNTNGGTGGGYGGVVGIPVVSGGRYLQAPEIVAVGGSGSGLLATSKINAAGTLVFVETLSPGHGYAAGLPQIRIDPTFEIEPAVLGTPVLATPVNPNGQYPLLSFAPPGTSPEALNNAFVMLGSDTTHPSPVGVDYLSTRLARSILEAVMAL